MNEPILRADDIEAWDMWMRTAAEHARTAAFARRVDSAKGVVAQAIAESQRVLVAWSGGKDSTAMTHLVCVECGAKADVFSEKDDLDYPGEEEYVRRLGEGWGLNLKIVKPDLSPAEFVRQHASEMVVADDIHGRSAKLSKTCFYGIVERANAGYDAVMLGLRTGESKERLRLRASRGRYFELASGQRRVLPIADWTGLDVFAYVVSREIELLPVYRCIGFMHAQEPWRLRKSWWLPGSSAAHGQVAWLRRYYPSLYRQMCDWMPGTSMLG